MLAAWLRARVPWHAVPTVADVDAAAAEVGRFDPRTIPPHDRSWGPVHAATATSAGALVPAASVLIRPKNEEVAIAASYVRALVPPDVFPRDDDTPESLALRLGASSFLDDIHYPIGGHGRAGRVVRLNDTKYPQPRPRCVPNKPLPRGPNTHGIALAKWGGCSGGTPKKA